MKANNFGIILLAAVLALGDGASLPTDNREEEAQRSGYPRYPYQGPHHFRYRGGYYYPNVVDFLLFFDWCRNKLTIASDRMLKCKKFLICSSKPNQVAMVIHCKIVLSLLLYRK